MIKFHCDGCGRVMAKGELRYKVKIDVRAAYDEIQIGLADLMRDYRQEMVDLVRKMRHRSPEEIEATVYKGFELDLCPACQRAYIRSPLRFHPEQAEDAEPIDIDGFLCSLGLHPPADGRSGDD